MVCENYCVIMSVYEIRFPVFLEDTNIKIADAVIYVGAENEEDITHWIDYVNNVNNLPIAIYNFVSAKVMDMESKMLSAIGITDRVDFLEYSLPFEVIGIDPTKVPDYVLPPK